MHWCIVSVGIVALIAVILRFLVRKITTNNDIVTHVDEFAGNLCSGVFIMELGVIASLYGGYSVTLGLAGFIHLFLKNTYFSSCNLYANPLAFIKSYYVNGRRVTFSVFFAASIIMTQLVALYCGQKFAKFIWAFEDHSHVDAMQVACTTAMSLIHPWTYAALSEGFGVLIGVSIDFLTPPKFRAAEGAFVTIVLFFLFTHISGMFMNPIIATAFSFRCEGHQSDWQHVAVYWIAPIIGVVLAWEFWLATNKFMKKKIPYKFE